MSEAGKGDRYRPVDRERYRRNYDRINWSDDGREGPDTDDRELLGPAALYLPGDPFPYTGLGWATVQEVVSRAYFGRQYEVVANVRVPFSVARQIMDPLMEVQDVELVCRLYLPDGDTVNGRWDARLSDAGDVRRDQWWGLTFQLTSSEALEEALSTCDLGAL